MLASGGLAARAFSGSAGPVTAQVQDVAEEASDSDAGAKSTGEVSGEDKNKDENESAAADSEGPASGHTDHPNVRCGEDPA